MKMLKTKNEKHLSQSSERRVNRRRVENASSKRPDTPPLFHEKKRK